MTTLQHRPSENLALREEESWQPPSYKRSTGRGSGLLAAIRRYFDLQAGSLWIHLKPILADAEGTVVDVGCGGQPYRPLLGPATHYIGIDTADALEHFGYDLAGVRTIASDGAWPVADQEADVLLATETLEHVIDPASFLLEARRVLRPGGRLILTVPFAARWHFIPHDYWRYTPSGLRVLLENAGFGEIEVYGRGNETTVACYKLMAVIMAKLLPQHEVGKPRLRIAALPLAPIFVLTAVVANRSLKRASGDDSLGYTVVAALPPV
jgi:SAM-dependent methyltransferase